MEPTHPEVTRIARHQNHGRWFIRISIGLLFVLVLVTVAGFVVFHSSDLTPQEAMAIVGQFKVSTTLVEVEQLLGKPRDEGVEHGERSVGWLFTKHGLNHIELLSVSMKVSNDGTVFDKSLSHGHIDGSNAWMFRWLTLKHRLGIK